MKTRQEEALLAEISSLLLSQKKNLQDYCLLLESMESAIVSHEDERIKEYTAQDRGFTEKMVSNMKTIQSYRKILAEIPGTIAVKPDIQVSLSGIENDISALKEKALALQDRNRERLEAEMALLKNEMLLVRKSIQERKRFPTSFSDEPRYIDIKS